MNGEQNEQPVAVLVGMVETMLKRSEQYRREAEEEGDLNEGEKHARVSSVLKEIVRLGKGLAAAAKSEKAPDVDGARSSPSPGSANQERRVRTEAERAEEREDLAYEMFSHIMGDVPWDCHVVILRSIYTELADYILTRFDRKPGVGLVEQSPDSEPRHSPSDPS